MKFHTQYGLYLLILAITWRLILSILETCREIHGEFVSCVEKV